MLMIMKNFFRKQRELVSRLKIFIQNMVKAQDKETYDEAARACKETLDFIMNFAVTIDEFLVIEKSKGETYELYQQAKEIWETVLKNRKVLEKAIENLRELKHDSSTLISNY